MNNTPLQRQSVQKHLCIFLDEKRLFLEHIDEKIKKATTGVNLIHNMNLLLPRLALIVCKCFIRPHQDYEGVIDEQLNLSSLANKIKSVQYNTTLAITGAIRGRSEEKLYLELSFEYIKDRR